MREMCARVCVCDSFTNLRWVHDDCWDKIEEDMVAVSSYSCVVESHLQLIHGLQQQTLCLIVKVFERGLLSKEQKRETVNRCSYDRVKSKINFLTENPSPKVVPVSSHLCDQIGVADDGSHKEPVVRDLCAHLHTGSTQVQVHLVVGTRNGSEGKIAHAV